MPAYQHTQIGSNMVLILIVVAVGLIGLGVFFSRLTITIEDGSLRAAFGAALTVKSVPLFEIASCQPIRIRWWYGWGIHLTPHGWLYNVAGNLHAWGYPHVFADFRFHMTLSGPLPAALQAPALAALAERYAAVSPPSLLDAV